MIAAYRWVLDKFKSRKITVILSIFFLLVIIAAAFYVFSPKKTPKEIYFDAESMNFTKYSESIKKSYKEFYASQEPYMNSRHKRRSEMTLKMEPGSDKPFGLENAKSIFDLVERCKIVIDSNCNPTEEKSVSNVSLLLEKAPLIDAQIFTAGKQLGFTVPVFTPDMYFKLDT